MQTLWKRAVFLGSIKAAKRVFVQAEHMIDCGQTGGFSFRWSWCVDRRKSDVHRLQRFTKNILGEYSNKKKAICLKHSDSITQLNFAWGEQGSSCPLRYLDEGPHGEEVGQHGGQALSQTALGNEACLQLGQADSIVALLPVPAWNVQQMGLCRITSRGGHRTQKWADGSSIISGHFQDTC